MSTNLKTLISKLNPTCRQAAERAINICMAQGHYEVDLEHLFLALLETLDNDFALLLKAYGISANALEKDLTNEISRFKRGNTRTPVFSTHLPTLFEHAWLLASLDAVTPICKSTRRYKSNSILISHSSHVSSRAA